MALVDKALVQGDDMALTGGGDITMVEGDYATLQAAQNRCMSVLGSWVHNTNFGCGLLDFVKEDTVWTVTEEMVYGQVERALTPMLSDGRIAEIGSVKIIQRTSDALYIEIKVKIGTKTGEVTYKLNF